MTARSEDAPLQYATRAPALALALRTRAFALATPRGLVVCWTVATSGGWLWLLFLGHIPLGRPAVRGAALAGQCVATNLLWLVIAVLPPRLPHVRAMVLVGN